jgi:hypothetical protein
VSKIIFEAQEKLRHKHSFTNAIVTKQDMIHQLIKLILVLSSLSQIK